MPVYKMPHYQPQALWQDLNLQCYSSFQNISSCFYVLQVFSSYSSYFYLHLLQFILNVQQLLVISVSLLMQKHLDIYTYRGYMYI